MDEYILQLHRANNLLDPHLFQRISEAVNTIAVETPSNLITQAIIKYSHNEFLLTRLFVAYICKYGQSYGKENFKDIELSIVKCVDVVHEMLSVIDLCVIFENCMHCYDDGSVSLYISLDMVSLLCLKVLNEELMRSAELERLSTIIFAYSPSEELIKLMATKFMSTSYRIPKPEGLENYVSITCVDV